MLSGHAADVIELLRNKDALFAGDSARWRKKSPAENPMVTGNANLLMQLTHHMSVIHYFMTLPIMMRFSRYFYFATTLIAQSTIQICSNGTRKKGCFPHYCSFGGT